MGDRKYRTQRDSKPTGRHHTITKCIARNDWCWVAWLSLIKDASQNHPLPVEPQADEASDDGAKRATSSQQQCNHKLQAATNATHTAASAITCSLMPDTKHAVITRVIKRPSPSHRVCVSCLTCGLLSASASRCCQPTAMSLHDSRATTLLRVEVEERKAAPPTRLPAQGHIDQRGILADIS